MAGEGLSMKVAEIAGRQTRGQIGERQHPYQPAGIVQSGGQGCREATARRQYQRSATERLGKHLL